MNALVLHSLFFVSGAAGLISGKLLPT